MSFLKIPKEYEITSLINQDTYLVSGDLKKWAGDTAEVYSTISSTEDYKPTLLGTVPDLGRNGSIGSFGFCLFSLWQWTGALANHEGD